MDGKRYFKDRCKEQGLDCDSLFQLGKSGVAVGERLSHRFNCNTRKDSQIFAVCYVEKENTYVAWSLKAKKAAGKSVFSVKWADIDLLLGNSILPAKKSIEHHGHGEEIVRAFAPEMVGEFLKRYCGGDLWQI